MTNVDLLKQIFGDNHVVTISSPEEFEEKMKDMAEYFKKVQPKENEKEHEHDCSKCKIPQNLCFAKPEIRNKFKDFAAGKAAGSIQRIIGGQTETSASFTMATILKFTNSDPEVSGLKPTLREIVETIKDGDEKVAAEMLLDILLLYLWCNNK